MAREIERLRVIAAGDCCADLSEAVLRRGDTILQVNSFDSSLSAARKRIVDGFLNSGFKSLLLAGHGRSQSHVVPILQREEQREREQQAREWKAEQEARALEAELRREQAASKEAARQKREALNP
jgi:hypothetical protein